MKRYLIKCTTIDGEYSSLKHHIVFSTVNSVYAVDLLTKLTEAFDPERSKSRAEFSMEIIEDGTDEEKEDF